MTAGGAVHNVLVVFSLQSYHLQILTSVLFNFLVTLMLPAPTHSGPSHVLATQGTAGTES